MKTRTLCILFASIVFSSFSIKAQKFSNYVVENLDDVEVKFYNILSAVDGGCNTVVIKKDGIHDRYNFGLRAFDNDMGRLKDYTFPGDLPSFLRITTFGNYAVVVGLDKLPVSGRPNALPVLYKIQAHIPGNELVVDEVFKAQDDKSEFCDKAFIETSVDGEYLIIGIEEMINWNALSDHKFHVHLRVYDKTMKCVWKDILKLEDIGNAGTRMTDVSFDYYNSKLYAVAYPAATPSSQPIEGITVAVYDQPGSIQKRKVSAVNAKESSSKFLTTPDGNIIVCSTETPTRTLAGVTGVNKIEFAKISMNDETESIVNTLLFDKDYYKQHPEYSRYSKQIAKPTQLLLCDDGIIYVSDYREYSDAVYGKCISFIKIGFNGDLIWNKMIVRESTLNSDDVSVKIFPMDKDYLILYAPLEANSGIAKLTADGTLTMVKAENDALPEKYTYCYSSLSGVCMLDDGRIAIACGLKYNKDYYFALRTLDMSGMK